MVVLIRPKTSHLLLTLFSSIKSRLGVFVMACHTWRFEAPAGVEVSLENLRAAMKSSREMSRFRGEMSGFLRLGSGDIRCVLIKTSLHLESRTDEHRDTCSSTAVVSSSVPLVPVFPFHLPLSIFSSYHYSSLKLSVSSWLVVEFWC